MSQVTRFNGDYNITGVDASSNVVVTAQSLVVKGNLLVLGTTSEVSTVNTKITDNILTLNAGETAAGVGTVYSGIEVDRGTLPTTSLRWNEMSLTWQITSDGTTFSDIATQESQAFEVYDDKAPRLGGNLDVSGQHLYDTASSTIAFDSGLAVKFSEGALKPVSGYSVIYSQTPGAGGSGVFVSNEQKIGEELITKSKAFIYALIL